MKQATVRIAMRVPVGGVTFRDALLIEGDVGWGEYSPLPGYRSDPATCMSAALDAANHPWPKALRSAIPVNALIPGVEPHEVEALATEILEQGATCVKVKVGVGDDLGRLRAVRDAFGWKIAVRVDANGKWDLEHARDVISKMERFQIEIVEQPVESLSDLALLRRRVSVPLAADESVRSIADARELARLHAADAIVVKVQPLGGVDAALSLAEAAEVPVIVTSMFETSVGLSAGLALAACLPELPYACGLGTATLLDGDVVSSPLVAERGWLTVRRPTPEPQLLALYARSTSF